MKIKGGVLSIALSSLIAVSVPAFSRAADIPLFATDINATVQPQSAPPKETSRDEKNLCTDEPLEGRDDVSLMSAARACDAQKEREKASAAYKRILEKFPGSPYKYDALYGLGLIRYREGDLKGARGLIGLVSEGPATDETLRAKAAALARDIDSVPERATVRQDLPAIGALLPVKRSEAGYAQFGEAALRGVLLAAGVFGDATAPAVEVYVRNAGSDPDAAARSVDDLATNQRVMGAVGPLLSSTALDVAARAQYGNLPVITLSQKEGLTEAGPYVYRNSLLPEQQAQAVASYAYRAGAKRFAVLYPENNYGTELAAFFKKEVKRLGGTIAAEASYQQGTTDFSKQLKSIFNVSVKARKEGRRTIKEFNANARIDALYIPDYYESVGMVLPYIEYFNIHGVRLLGTNGWNSARLLEAGRVELEGAVFVDGFFSGTRRPGSREFAARFTSAYGTSPDVLEAQSYDSAKVLIGAVLQSRADGGGRQTVIENLNKARGYNGAEGALWFDTKREAVKKLFILTVKDGAIVEAEN